MTKRMIPPAEQSLRFLEKLEDEAADALAETPIAHYDDKDGTQRILNEQRRDEAATTIQRFMRNRMAAANPPT